MAALVAVGVLALGASPAAAHEKGKKTLRVTATENQSEFLDLGAPGLSVGDQLVISQILYRRGHEVGDGGVVCTVTEVTAPYDVFTAHCVATLRLRAGSITLQALVEFQSDEDVAPFTVAITGGTGRFFGAGGEARIRVRGERTIYRLRYVLPRTHTHHHHG
jgi:hypothetical protein